MKRNDTNAVTAAYPCCEVHGMAHPCEDCAAESIAEQDRADAVRDARPDWREGEIQRLHKQLAEVQEAYLNMRQWAEANGLDTAAHNDGAENKP